MGVMGAGKTTISKSLDGFTHFGIDQFYPQAKRDYSIKNWYEDRKYCIEAYQMMFNGIVEKLQTGNVIMEFTGASEHGIDVMKKLEEISNIEVFRVMDKVPMEVLQNRVAERNVQNWPVQNATGDLYEAFCLIHEFKPKVDFIVDGNRETKEIIKEILTNTGNAQVCKDLP